MAWLRIDDGFAEHRKIDALSDRAFRVHVSALCLCARKLTDGYVDARDVRSLLARIGATKRHVNELESQQIWSSNGSGYVIRDYLDYNPSAEQVREERNRAAERMRRIRSGERSGEHAGERSGEVRPGVRGPRPVLKSLTPTNPPPGLDQREGRAEEQNGKIEDNDELPIPPLDSMLRDMPL